MAPSSSWSSFLYFDSQQGGDGWALWESRWRSSLPHRSNFFLSDQFWHLFLYFDLTFNWLNRSSSILLSYFMRKKFLLSYTDICHPISEYRDFDLLIACKNIQNSRLLKAIFFLNKDIRLFFANNWLIWGSKEILLVLNLLAVISCPFHVVCVGP